HRGQARERGNHRATRAFDVRDGGGGHRARHPVTLLHTSSRLMHTQSMQMTQQNLAAISERYFAAWAAHDPDAIVALHTADTQFWMHMGGDPVVGRDAVRDTFAEIFTQFPDFTWETYRMILG